MPNRAAPNPRDDFLARLARRVLAGALIFIGILFRVRHLMRIDLNEPFRLGGLFHEFSQQIILNHYALPATIPYYSTGGIPFAYPPLGFYVQAAILSLFSPSQFLTVNLLPPLVAALCVPSFYVLLRKLTGDTKIIFAALFAYAFMPAAFVNQIEAAGLAEAFGTLALIWYAYFLLEFERQKSLRNALWAGLLLAASVTASPGAAVASAALSVIYAVSVMLRRPWKQEVVRLLAIGGIGLLASAPYWLTAARNHGAGIFITPLLAQYNGPETGSFIARFGKAFFEFNYAGGKYALAWNALILLGLLWHLFNRRWFVPTVFFAFALIPRESVWLTALVTPLLAASGLVEMVLPPLGKAFKALPKKSCKLTLLAGTTTILFFILAFNAIASVDAMIADPEWQITEQQIRALEDVRAQIPPDAPVLAVGNEAFMEWSPQILQREVINVKFGLEWQPDEFVSVMSINQAIQAGKSWDEILTTIQTNTGYDSVYVVFSQNGAPDLEIADPHLQPVAGTDSVTVKLLSFTR
ncbi:MAG: hypothetical protein GXP40_09815 [Chloroflexi bacterium]|nr:hypothetical protein [Chloroflexota bacterium]